MKFRDWRERVWHRLRGHGKPVFYTVDQFAVFYRCPKCSELLCRTLY